MAQSDIKTQRQPDIVFPLEQPEEGVYETYANTLDADWSLTDVTFRFMQLVFSPPAEGATTKNRRTVVFEKANITVPWWQAKVAAGMLTNLVKAYEDANGEIKPPVLAVLPKPESPTEK